MSVIGAGSLQKGLNWKRDVTPGRVGQHGGTPERHIRQRGVGGARYILWSCGSLRTSPTYRMTVWLPKFFHQCEVPNTSGLISPALCKMGSAQLLAYSTISPCCTKMRAGRSSWLCHGTMPPGSIVSLRKRNSRSLRCAGCFSRSIEPNVTSVTPTGLNLTSSRASAFILPAGHSPAKADDAVAADPAMTQANARPCQSAREFAVGLNMSLSPLLCRGLG